MILLIPELENNDDDSFVNDEADTQELDLEEYDEDDWDDVGLSVPNEDSTFDIDEFELKDEYDGCIAVSIKCACHTLQMTVNDVLRKPAMLKRIAKSRALAKKLRTPNMATILRNMKLNQAIIDVPTRWSSSCDMEERLLKLKSFCQKFEETQKECKLSEANWNFIEELVEAFAPVKVSFYFIMFFEFYKIYEFCFAREQRLSCNVKI